MSHLFLMAATLEREVVDLANRRACTNALLAAGFELDEIAPSLEEVIAFARALRADEADELDR